MVTDSSANSGKNGKYDKFTGEKFTVVHVTNYYFPTLGGITTQVYYLVKHFAQRGIESKVIHFPLIFRQITNLFYFKPLKRIIHFLFVFFFVVFAVMQVLFYRITKGRLVVHSHDAYFCALVGIISKLFGCRSIHIMRTTFEYRSRPSFKWIQTLIFNSCDLLTFVSHFMLNEFRKTFPKVKTSGRVTYSGIDAEKFHLVHKDKLIMEYLGMKGPFLLFVGNLIPGKDPMLLVDIVKAVKKKYPNIVMLIIGDGYLKTQIARRIAREELQDNIFLVGEVPRDKILQYYRLADIYVMPTLMEALGNSVMEAMATGKPVVASNVGGIKDIQKIIPFLFIQSGDLNAPCPNLLPWAAGIILNGFLHFFS